MLKTLISLLALAATLPLHAAITFDSSMESGNGTNFTQISPDAITFELEIDTHSDDSQWFFFSVAGAQGETLTFRLQHADQTNVPEHWPICRPVASSDGGETWAPINGGAEFASPEFVFTHTLGGDPELIAYCYPHTHSRVVSCIASWESHPDVAHSVVGQSVQGRDIDLLTITADPDAPHPDRLGFWIIVREHAAEVTGSWMLEGFMDFMLSDDPRAESLRDRSVTNVIPMINPDGVAIGNYRDNAMGVNLNVVWGHPASSECTEVAAVTDAIGAWVDEGNSFDLFVSLHSASAVTFNWAYHPSDDIHPPLAADPEGYPSELKRFLDIVEANAPDFLASEGVSGSTRADVSRQWAMFNYGVLSLLFEGTYAHTTYGPHAGEVMTPERHRAIGRALGIAMHDYFIEAE